MTTQTASTEIEMQDEIMNLFESRMESQMIDSLEAEATDMAGIAEVTTFEAAGVMTYNAGLVIRMANGAEFQVTIVQSQNPA